MKAANAKVGGAGAARPAQVGKQGGLVPQVGTHAFKKVDIRFLKAHDLIEALIEKDLARNNKNVSERALQIVRYVLGLEYLVDVEDEDVKQALWILHNIILDLRYTAQHSVEFTRHILDQFKRAGILVEVDE
jgi:hypothetical protein